MDDNRSSETLLEGLLLPEEFFLGVLIDLEELAVEFNLALFNCLVGRLFFGCSLTLILKVEPDWKLEITLDGTALMFTVH